MIKIVRVVYLMTTKSGIFTSLIISKIIVYMLQLEFPDNYLLSVLSLGRFGCDIIFDKLGTSYNRSDWILHSSVHEINACYAPQENSVGKDLYILFDWGRGVPSPMLVSQITASFSVS